MSDPLFKEVCALVRAVQTSPSFDGVAKALSAAHRSDLKQGPPSNTLLTEYAKSERSQFAGYLKAHSQVDTIAQALGPAGVGVQPLDEVSWRSFSEGHLVLKAIVHELVVEMVLACGDMARACDPYLLAPELPIAPGTDAAAAIEAVSASAKKVAKALAGHPALREAGGLRAIMGGKPLESTAVARALFDVSRRAASGLLEDRALAELRGKLPGMPPPVAAAYRTIGSLFAVAQSVRSICQLCFMGYAHKALPTLNAENIFKVGPTNLDGLSENWELHVQPTGNELFARPGDLLYVDLPADAQMPGVRGPMQIAGVNLRFSNETGCVCVFRLHNLDEWLNPYRFLLTRG